jgi:hypothetical protein
MDSKELTPGPVVHEKLSDTRLARITRIQKVFSDVDPSPLSKWIEDFSRDQNPDREIGIWEGMVTPYQRFTAKRFLTLSGKREVYQIVLLRSAAPDNEVLKRLNLKVLTEADAKEVLSMYSDTPQPITVISQ